VRWVLNAERPSIFGNPDFVRMRFNHEFLEMAVEGEL